jgi:hypothetical protein
VECERLLAQKASADRYALVQAVASSDTLPTCPICRETMTLESFRKCCAAEARRLAAGEKNPQHPASSQKRDSTRKQQSSRSADKKSSSDLKQPSKQDEVSSHDRRGEFTSTLTPSSAGSPRSSASAVSRNISTNLTKGSIVRHMIQNGKYA